MKRCIQNWVLIRVTQVNGALHSVVTMNGLTTGKADLKLRERSAFGYTE